MRWPALAVLGLLLAPGPGSLSAQRPAAKPADDIVLKALRDELDRSRQLRVGASSDLPYFIEYLLDDAESFSLGASLGGLIVQRKNRVRLPRVQVRVGDYKFDNTNYVMADYYFGTRYDPEQLPQDENYMALRHGLWLATDRAFKTAVQAIGRKRAAIKNINLNEELADFYPAEPVKLLGNVARVPFDEAGWRTRTVALSTVFAEYPQVLGSSVEFESSQSTSYLLNSEGAEIRVPDHLTYLRARAQGLAADGMSVRDHVVFQTVDLGRLPAEADLRRGIVEVARNVTALVAAPAGESYTGPVLFEGTAAAQLMADVLGSQLAARRRPVPEPGRPVQTPSSEFEERTGSRILPAWMNVVDDPTLKEWSGRPLLGFYPVDMEGVVPKPVTLVENGVLKGFLLTRQPVRGSDRSNGRARLPGNFGGKSAAFGNLIVRATETIPAAQLKQRLISLVRERNKAYGILVRKLDLPSSASFDELRRMAAGSSQSGSARPALLPLLVYRVYPDGKEELVRGLRFRSLGGRSLRDILAASDEMHQFDYIANSAPFSMMTAGGYVAPSSVVAPSLLFEELELERPREDLTKPPIVPPPALVSTR